MRRKGFVGVLAILALSAGLAVSGGTAAQAVTGDDAPREYVYTANGATVPNPDRGVYSDQQHIGTTFTTTRAAEVAASGWRLVHGDNDLSAFTGVAPSTTTVISEEWKDGLRTALKAVRDNGLKIILHFTYSPRVPGGVETNCDPNEPTPSNVPPDAPLSVIEAQLADLRPIFDEYLDVISSLDAGFAGEWGEWHCSTNMLLSDENKPALFQALFDGFPESRQINFRYPEDIKEYLAAHPENLPRVANYQACYASGPNGEDMGTWPPGASAQQQMKTWLGETVGAHNFVGLVVCNPSKETSPADRLSCQTAVGDDGRGGEFALMHVSYFDGDFYEPRFGPAFYGQCWDDIVNRLGYRLQLERAQLPQSLEPGTSADISITLRNDGFASVISPRTAYLVLDSGSERRAIPLDADPRSWASQTSVTIEQSIEVPDHLPDGEYRLSLWLPDPADLLRDRPEYAIQFANDGVWNATTGDNTLAVGVPLASRPALAETGGSAGHAVVPMTFAALALASGVIVIVTRLGRGGRRIRRSSTS